VIIYFVKFNTGLIYGQVLIFIAVKMKFTQSTELKMIFFRY